MHGDHTVRVSQRIPGPPWRVYLGGLSGLFVGALILGSVNWIVLGRVNLAPGLVVSSAFVGGLYIRFALKRAYDKALEDLTEAIHLDPIAAHAYHNRGLVWRWKGDRTSSKADLDEAERLDPSLRHYQGWI